MAPSGPAPAMVGNETSFRSPLSRRKALQRLDRVDLGQAARRLAVEPGQKLRHRGAVAQLRRAGAGDFGCVLHRLHRRDRIAAAHDLAAVLDDEARDRLGAGRGIEPHGAMRLAELGEIALEGGVGAQLGNLLETRAYIVAELAQVDIERRTTFLRHRGEGQHHRRVRHVAAADVEQPRHILRIGHHQRVGGPFSISACRRLSLSAVVSPA